MTTWKNFLDSLDTTGGHILLLIGVLVMLFGATHAGMQSADKFMGEAFGALLYSLRGQIPAAK